MSTFPRAFGRYTLLASLGRGGMGEVYAASVAGGVGGIEKRCVVKTLHASGASDRESVTRFLDEARLAVLLNQRNICPVFDVGVVDGQHYLAMELIRGRDLRTLGHRARDVGMSIGVGLAIHIVTEALEGLDYAHELTDEAGRPLNVVHRDVSPQNVMVSFDGDVKIIDFGLAASELKVEQTEANVVMGKVAYMPPEQVRGERADRSADVFAAAVVLYELLTGTRYYDGVAPLMLASVVAGGAHRAPRMDSLDAGLRAILLSALEPRRARRTSSAGALAEALRTWAREHQHGGDAAGLRRLMRDLFGAPRDVWESAAFPAQRPTSQPPLRVVAHGAPLDGPYALSGALRGVVDPDTADDTDRRASLATESATIVDGEAPAARARAEVTSATDIVRPSTLAPLDARPPRRAPLVAAGVVAGLAVVGACFALFAGPEPAVAPEPPSTPASARSSSSDDTGSAPPPTAPPPTAPTPSTPPPTAPTPSTPPTTPTPPTTAPLNEQPSRSPAPAPRVRPAVDPSAAAVARLDAVVDAAPLEQLKVVRAVCGPDACAGVNLLDEQTPARIARCLHECKDTVRRRVGR